MFHFLVSSVVLFAANLGFAQTMVGEREVILDNEEVQVVRLTYPVGTESGMHTHEFPNRAVYFVKGGRLSLVSNDSAKTERIIEVVDGQALFLPATTHNVRNVGTTEIVIIETELKP
jgi:mannose-6-phosphate isomerase-like protein (cupin superfamily)